MKNKIEERLKKELEGKTKTRTMKEDKWKMKEYILSCSGEDSRDIMLIRLHMCAVQMNYKKETGKEDVPFMWKKGGHNGACNRMWTRNEKMYDLKDE